MLLNRIHFQIQHKISGVIRVYISVKVGVASFSKMRGTEKLFLFESSMKKGTYESPFNFCVMHYACDE